MRISIILLIALLQTIIITAQDFNWDKNYGGTSSDEIFDFIISPDGHLVGIGLSNSDDFDLDGSNPDRAETWFLRIDQNGNVITSKTIPLDGFGDLSVGCDIINYENGFLFTNGGEIIRVSDQGDIIWRLNNFDPGVSFFRQNASLYAFSDGSFFMLSESVPSNYYVSNYWLGKFNPSGELQWSNTYGGSGIEIPKSLLVDENGNLYLFGSATSDDGDVSNHYGSDIFADVWIVHVDGENGDIIWERNYGGTGNDEAEGIVFTESGTIMFLAYVMFIDEDIEEDPNNFGRNWVVEINTDGEIIFQSRYGINVANSLQKFNDAFIIGGEGLQDNGICCDYEYIIFDRTTEYVQASVGGTSLDNLYNILPVDNNILLYGRSTSDDGDVSGHYGSGFYSDAWLYFFSYNVPCINSIEETLCFDETIEVGGEIFDVNNRQGEVEIGTGVNGCDSIVRVDLSFLPEIQLLFENVEEDDGSGNGSIQVIAFGGSGNLSYEWSNGENSENISGLEAGTYELTITDSRGCTAEFTFEVDGPTNNLEISTSEINFWPNPTSDFLYFEELRQDIEIEIYNSLGIRQSNFSLGSSRINVSSLSSGVYRIIINKGNKEYQIAKFVKT